MSCVAWDKVSSRDQNATSWRMTSIVGTLIISLEAGDLSEASTGTSILDLVGGSCEATRFFSKRNECSCLKEKLQHFKTEHKVGVCNDCRKTKRRSEMMYVEDVDVSNTARSNASS